MKTVSQGLTYVFGEKDNLLIVILCGSMNGKELSALEQCCGEIATKTQKAIILSFRDVSNIFPASFIALAKIQKTIRDSGRFVALASIKPELKTPLLFSGIVRESEMFNNIPDAWNNLVARMAQDTKARAAASAKSRGSNNKAA